LRRVFFCLFFIRAKSRGGRCCLAKSISCIFARASLLSGAMKLEFTAHAKFRIFSERNISVADIKKVIENPDGVRYEIGGLVKCKKKLDKKELIVIYSKGKNNVFVIVTAYFK